MGYDRGGIPSAKTGSQNCNVEEETRRTSTPFDKIF